MASHTMTHLHRRAVLGGIAAAPFATEALALDKVGFAVPAGACDCHHHIYDKRWPYAKTAVLKPPPATTADYRKYQAQLGTSRSIAVTPSTYAFNNDPAADFISAQWPNARGVAVAHRSDAFDRRARSGRHRCVPHRRVGVANRDACRPLGSRDGLLHERHLARQRRLRLRDFRR